MAATEAPLIDVDTINQILNNQERLNAEVDTMFTCYDADESGKLDPQEFKNVVIALCAFIGLPNPPQEVVQEMLDDTDQDGDGLIDKSELNGFIKKLLELFKDMSDEDLKALQKESQEYEAAEAKRSEEEALAAEAGPAADADGDDEDAEGDDDDAEGDDEDEDDE